MSDMKLIMENWRSFEKAAKNMQQTHVFLFENNEPVKADFNVLLEKYDNKQITEDQLIKLWEDSFNYEYEQLLEEVDWEKEAEMTADPDYKPPHEREQVGIAEKINDFILKLSIQAHQMIEKGSVLAFKAVSKAAGLVGKFKDRHPLLTKVILAILLSLVIYGLMSFLDPAEAQAKIKVGDRVLGDQAAQAIRGSFDTIVRSDEALQQYASQGVPVGPLGLPSVEYMETRAQFEEIIRLAQSSPKEIPVEKLVEMLPKNLERAAKLAETISTTVVDLVETAQDTAVKADAAFNAGKITSAEHYNVTGGIRGLAEWFKKWKSIAAGLDTSDSFTTFAHHVPMPKAGMFK